MRKRPGSKRILGKAISLLLAASLLAPSTAPLVAYAAETMSNRPRLVSFERPEALSLSEVGISGNSSGSRDSGGSASSGRAGGAGNNGGADNGGNSNDAGNGDAGNSGNDDTGSSTGGSTDTGGGADTGGGTDTGGGSDTGGGADTGGSGEDKDASGDGKDKDDGTAAKPGEGGKDDGLTDAEEETDPSGSGGGAGGGGSHSGGKPGELPDVDLAGMALDQSTAKVIPSIINTDAMGRSATGVIIHGVTRGGAEVAYALIGGDGETERKTAAEGSIVYPDFTEQGADLPSHYPPVKSSNWESSGYPVEGLLRDTIYNFAVTFTASGEDNGDGEDGGDSPDETYVYPEDEENSFLIYKVQLHDLAQRIAKHYGVNPNVLARDNRLYLDQLTEAVHTCLSGNRRQRTRIPRNHSLPWRFTFYGDCFLVLTRSVSWDWNR